MPTFLGDFMVASSVTGVSGPGESNGKYKPENNCSCSCCCGKSEPQEQLKKIKIGCYTRYSSPTSNNYKISNVSSGIKIC
jgi:hypothetical protein